MKIKGLALGLALLGVVPQGPAAAQGLTNAELLVTLAQSSYLLCSIEWKTALLSGDRSTAQKCIGEEKVTRAEDFMKVLADFKGKPAAVKLLKDYQAFWNTSIDSLAPQIGESNASYELRVARTKLELERNGKPLLAQ